MLNRRDPKSPEQAENRFRLRPALIRMGVSALILFMASQYLDLERVLLVAHRLNPLVLGFVAAALLLLLAAGAFRWWWLMRLQGYTHGIGWVVRVRMIAQGLSIVLPGGVSGDILSVFYIRQYPDRPPSHAMGTVFADRILGMAAIAIVFVVAVFAGPTTRSLLHDLMYEYSMFAATAFALGAVLLIAVVFIARRYAERFYHALLNAFNVLRAYKNSPGTLLLLLAISIVLHLVVCLLIWLIANDLGTVPLWSVTGAVSATMLLSILPFSYNGLGIRDAIFMILLTGNNFTEEAAVVLSLSWFVLTILVYSVSGLIVSSFTPPPEKALNSTA